jgi:DNA repair exonuclease SbcCD ATPase subunit
LTANSEGSLNPETADNASVLESIVDFACGKLTNRAVDSCCQTEVGSVEGPMEALDSHVRHLRKSLTAKKENMDSESLRTAEEKMIAFQRECEERYRQETDLRIRYIRENEVAKVRAEESRRAHAELELLRKELEAGYKHRLQLHSEREAEAMRKAAERDRANQQTQFEARERLQREIDDLRDREKAASRKIELETQGLHMLELRMKEIQAVLESREREVSDREKEIDRKSREYADKARAEARAGVQAELDTVMRERMSLILDRQRLEDERASQAAWLEAAQTTRSLLREAQTSLLEKEEEIKSLSAKLSKFTRDVCIR